MTDYVPPLADIRFALRGAANLDAIVATERFGHVDADTVFDVLAEVGRFTADVVAPTNRDGDTVGSQWQTRRDRRRTTELRRRLPQMGRCRDSGRCRSIPTSAAAGFRG